MGVYEFLSKLWYDIFFTINTLTKREDAIKCTSSVLFYFFVAHTEKNKFYLTVSKYLRAAKINQEEVRDKLLIFYRDFFRTKKLCEFNKIPFGTKGQLELLKLEAKNFLEKNGEITTEFLELCKSETK